MTPPYAASCDTAYLRGGPLRISAGVVAKRDSDKHRRECWESVNVELVDRRASAVVKALGEVEQ
jgi:hypothetical protein